jgi:hypothetical protein
MPLGAVRHHMTREVRLNHIGDVLAELDYPVTRSEAAAELGDVTLDYADGEEALTQVLERIHADEFESANDLQASLFSALPVESVGEPGQSEGEG